MFSNFFNSAKNAMDSLAEAAQQQQNQQQQPPTQPAPPAPQQQQQHQGASGGQDFLSGLMNVAQEVGKAIGEKSQEGAQAVKSGATSAADTTKTTAEGAGRLTKEEIDKITSGIGDLVGKATSAFSQKQTDVEEEITAVDAQGGKIQISSVHEKTEEKQTAQGGDFLSGLVDVAKQVGQAIGEKSQEGAGAVKSGATHVADTTKTTAEGAGKFTKEEMDKIAAGIGELVGKAAGAFGKKEENVEEQVTAVDSQGGKVQISSVQDKTTTEGTKPAQGGDFLSGLVDVAKQVGQAIGEKSQEGATAVKSGATNVAETTKSTAQGAGQFTKEEMDKIAAGIGDLVGKAAGALNIGEKKKEGSPEAPPKAETAETSKPAEGGDFLSGLIGMAKEVGKSIDLKKGEGKKEDDFSASKPEVDDIEGEIGKVVTAGYTSEKAVQPIEGGKEAFLSRMRRASIEGLESARNLGQGMKHGASATIYAIREQGGEAVCVINKGAETVFEGMIDAGFLLEEAAKEAVMSIGRRASNAFESVQNVGDSVFKDAEESAWAALEEFGMEGDGGERQQEEPEEPVKPPRSRFYDRLKHTGRSFIQDAEDSARDALEEMGFGGGDDQADERLPEKDPKVFNKESETVGRHQHGDEDCDVVLPGVDPEEVAEVDDPVVSDPAAEEDDPDDPEPADQQEHGDVCGEEDVEVVHRHYEPAEQPEEDEVAGEDDPEVVVKKASATGDAPEESEVAEEDPDFFKKEAGPILESSEGLGEIIKEMEEDLAAEDPDMLKKESESEEHEGDAGVAGEEDPELFCMESEPLEHQEEGWIHQKIPKGFMKMEESEGGVAGEEDVEVVKRDVEPAEEQKHTEVAEDDPEVIEKLPSSEGLAEAIKEMEEEFGMEAGEDLDEPEKDCEDDPDEVKPVLETVEEGAESFFGRGGEDFEGLQEVAEEAKVDDCLHGDCPYEDNPRQGGDAKDPAPGAPDEPEDAFERIKEVPENLSDIGEDFHFVRHSSEEVAHRRDSENSFEHLEHASGDDQQEEEEGLAFRSQESGNVYDTFGMSACKAVNMFREDSPDFPQYELFGEGSRRIPFFTEIPISFNPLARLSDELPLGDISEPSRDQGEELVTEIPVKFETLRRRDDEEEHKESRELAPTVDCKSDDEVVAEIPVVFETLTSGDCEIPAVPKPTVEMSKSQDDAITEIPVTFETFDSATKNENARNTQVCTGSAADDDNCTQIPVIFETMEQAREVPIALTEEECSKSGFLTEIPIFVDPEAGRCSLETDGSVCGHSSERKMGEDWKEAEKDTILAEIPVVFEEKGPSSLGTEVQGSLVGGEIHPHDPLEHDVPYEKKEISVICPACEEREDSHDSHKGKEVKIELPNIPENKIKGVKRGQTEEEEEEEEEVLPRRGLRAPMRGFRSRSPSASSSKIVSSSSDGVQETNLIMDVTLDRRPMGGGASVSIAPRLYFE